MYCDKQLRALTNDAQQTAQGDCAYESAFPLFVGGMNKLFGLKGRLVLPLQIMELGVLALKNPGLSNVSFFCSELAKLSLISSRLRPFGLLVFLG